jgi:hypothetical protein
VGLKGSRYSAEEAPALTQGALRHQILLSSFWLSGWGWLCFDCALSDSLDAKEADGTDSANPHFFGNAIKVEAQFCRESQEKSI